VTTGPSSFDAPDRRYWRRRNSRGVREARRARTLLRLCGILLVNGLVAAVLIYSGARAFGSLTRSDLFSLRTIEVEGTHRAPAEAIRGELNAWLGHNLFEIDLGSIESGCLGNPWVQGADVRRVLPDTLRVRLHERVPGAVALIGGRAHLVDTTGYVIGPTGAGLAEDVPVLKGLDGLEGEPLAAALRRGVRSLEQLRRASSQFSEGISELDLAYPDLLLVRTVSSGPPLLLDPVQVDRNVRRYMNRREEIERRVGRMQYVDLRWEDRISVLPARQ